MSWRLCLRPAHDKYEDWSLPEFCTDEEIIEMAEEIAWKPSLKIFTPSGDDARLKTLINILNDQCSMTSCDYTVYVPNEDGKKWRCVELPCTSPWHQHDDGWTEEQCTRARVLDEQIMKDING